MALRHDDANNVTDTPLFRLYLQTKLTNPHYTPELQAQTTLVNFTVTERGLEDQLLALVVNKERPDLEEQRAELVEQQNQFTIKLKQLEDDLLHRLATAEGDILGDEELIISLEVTKATVIEISEKVGVAKATSLKINQARETYRPVAARGSLIYFLIDTLNVIDHMYQFSLAAFNFIYSKVPQHPARRVSPRLSTPLHATSRHATRHTPRHAGRACRTCHAICHTTLPTCIEGARQGRGERPVLRAAVPAGGARGAHSGTARQRHHHLLLVRDAPQHVLEAPSCPMAPQLGPLGRLARRLLGLRAAHARTHRRSRRSRSAASSTRRRRLPPAPAPPMQRRALGPVQARALRAPPAHLCAAAHAERAAARGRAHARSDRAARQATQRAGDQPGGRLADRLGLVLRGGSLAARRLRLAAAGHGGRREAMEGVVRA